MGQEIKCRVDYSGKSSDGKALLETSAVLFRGGFRLKIPFREIQAIEASEHRLLIRFPEGEAVFHLGPAAQKWAEKIRNPPGRLDKLGIKAGTKVRLIGRHDADFRRELADRGAITASRKPEIAFLLVENKEDLVELAYLKEAPVWVIYPKGVQTVTEANVIAAGRDAGFIDSKVCSFSATHTALRFKPR